MYLTVPLTLVSVGHIFLEHMFKLVSSVPSNSGSNPVPVNFVDAVHDAMGESMLTLILGNVRLRTLL